VAGFLIHFSTSLLSLTFSLERGALSSLLLCSSFSGLGMKIPMNLHILRWEVRGSGGGWPAGTAAPPRQNPNLIFLIFFALFRNTSSPPPPLSFSYSKLSNNRQQLSRSKKTKKEKKKELPLCGFWIGWGSFVLYSYLIVCVLVRLWIEFEAGWSFEVWGRDWCCGIVCRPIVNWVWLCCDGCDELKLFHRFCVAMSNLRITVFLVFSMQVFDEIWPPSACVYRLLL